MLSNRRQKEIRSLTRKKCRDRLGEALVEGSRAVEAVMNAGVEIRDLLVTEEALGDRRLAGRVDALGDAVHVISPDELDALSDVETSQGVLAIVAIELIEAAALSSCTRLLALDGIRDPGNAGALVRTAAWFGVDAVVTSAGTVDLYNPKVVRAAMGGLWDVGHAIVEDLASTLKSLRLAGFAAYGADVYGTPIESWQPRHPSVLVLGSEAHGLSACVREILDECILIPGRPQRGGAESLNVAVAAGILTYEWTRPREKGGPYKQAGA